MPRYSLNKYLRIEPRAYERNLNVGLAAAIHDPAWFLARQWQMGEHQGEDASTPVAVKVDVAHSPIQAAPAFQADPHFDPRRVPVDAIAESELDDWWTMGRRIRAGQYVAARANPVALPDQARFENPAPPYEHFHEFFDGRALWQRRDELGIGNLFGVYTPPAEGPYSWQSDQLVYETEFDAQGTPITMPKHHGGIVDWYSFDQAAQHDAVPDLGGDVTRQVILPSALYYPGAPANRWWEIENAAQDVGGEPPDTAHFATMLLVDLVFSHGDDWFLFPVQGQAGQFITVEAMTVVDSFGLDYAAGDAADGNYPGLLPPKDWSIFKTTGLRDETLALWLTSVSPLEGDILEEVLFGIDEYVNLLWAVEKRLDSADPTTLKVSEKLEGTRLNSGTLQPDRTRPHEFAYLPSEQMVARWHPYELINSDDGPRRFVQRGLVDFSLETPKPMPFPQAEVLRPGLPGNRVIHEIDPAAVPANGIAVERRWMLARDTEGHPVLWLQRQRKPLIAPPARRIRFDVLEEAVAKL